MSEDKSGKHRWRDPVVLVPIITAVIASIVGPTYYYYFLTPKPAPEPIPTPTPESTPSSATGSVSSPAANITVETDKESYTIGEVVTISGNVSKPESGKSLRIDVYNPNGDILLLANGIKVDPNRRGLYSHDLHTDLMTMGGEIMPPGKYEVLVSYLNLE